MKVEVEEITSVKRRISVQVPAENVTEEIENAYKDLKKTAKIKGFRPGKTPRSILERFYGDQVKMDVTSKIIQDTYSKSLVEKDITPVSQPEIEDIHLEPGEDFTYTAVVEIKPVFDVTGYTGLELKKEEADVTDEKVNERLEETRTMFGRLEDIAEKRPVADGDYVLIERRVLLEGEPLEDQQSQEQVVHLAENEIAEEIRKALIGAQIDEEKIVAYKFPANYPVAEAAGKDGETALKVKSIKARVLPDLDDEFAKKLGEFKSLDELKAKIKEDLEQEENQRIKAAQDQAMIEQILKTNSFDVPDSMVELQIDEMIRNTERRLTMHGMSLERAGADLEKLRDDYREQAVNAVKASLVLEAVAKKESIEASNQDVEDAFQRISERTGRTPNEIKELYKEQSRIQYLKDSIIEENTLDFLRKGAKIVDK